MNVACIMDPLESINYEKDTSYFLLLGASELGHSIFHIDQNNLFLKDTDVYAQVSKLRVTGDKKLEVLEENTIPLSEMQLIIVRKDPPFDRRYFYTTLLLDFLPESTRVSNSPQSLRDWNEKLSALDFPEYCPPTLVASQWTAIKAFAEEHESRLVIKPLDGNGGKGIEFVNHDDPKIEEVFKKATNNFSHQIVIQKYVPETKEGDVRVLFVKDKVLGAIIRKAPEGKELNNLDQGATAHPWELTPKQKQICDEMGPKMLARGVTFVGIDFLGDTLIEINVTSSTGLQEISKFYNKPFHHMVIEELLS